MSLTSDINIPKSIVIGAAIIAAAIVFHASQNKYQIDSAFRLDKATGKVDYCLAQREAGANGNYRMVVNCSGYLK